MFKEKKLIAFIFGIIAAYIIWTLISKSFNSSILFPSILEVLKSLVKIFETESFYKDLLTSILRVFLTFLIAIILASVLGVISGLNSFVNYFLMPFISAGRTMPLLPLILIAVIWFTPSFVPVFVGFLMIFPIIYEGVVSGIHQVDKKLIEMSLSYNVSVKNKIKDLYIPSVMPYFFNSISVSMGITWKSVLAAEILALPALGIGTKLYESHLYLNTAELFAYAIIAIFFNAVFEILIKIKSV